VPQLLAAQRVIVWAWDKDQFLRGDADHAQEDTSFVESVDSAITSVVWWSWLRMIEHICKVLRRATAWLERCPCHESFLKCHGESGEIPKWLHQAVLECPLRARRAAEYSSGGWIAELEQAFTATIASLVVELPNELADRDRQTLLQALDLARAHMMFYCTAKLAYASQEPWFVVQVAHLDRDVAVAALRRVLASTHRHRLLRTLRGELRPQCRLFINGAEWGDPELRPLARLVGGLRMIPTTERPVEGQHAKIKKHGGFWPTHSEPFMSFKIRHRELAKAITNDPVFLASFAYLFGVVSNPGIATDALGLTYHPEIIRAASERVSRRFDRHLVHTKVIYHSDSMTLYSAAPELDSGDSSDDGKEDVECDDLPCDDAVAAHANPRGEMPSRSGCHGELSDGLLFRCGQ